MATWENQTWPAIGLEATLSSPCLSDLDWLMEAHEYLGDAKFFSLFDKWLGKRDVSALFEMLHVQTLKDRDRQILRQTKEVKKNKNE